MPGQRRPDDAVGDRPGGFRRRSRPAPDASRADRRSIRAAGAELPAQLADGAISAASDRAFIEAYYARQGNGVRIRSVDDERLTMSDGQKMLISTELGGDPGEGDSRPTPLDVPTLLASRLSTTS